jgi:hypothetical protein
MVLPVGETLRVALLSYSADMFTSHMLLDRTPWLWENRTDYVNWKSSLAGGLSVDPYALMVVGSACTGVSLNPKKRLFAEFRAESDVDVAVVSYYHFEVAWKTLREMGQSTKTIPTSEERRLRKQHRDHLVFDGTIATDWVLPYLPFGREWMHALQNSESELPGPRHKVKARIYRDLDALRAYHVRNVTRLKKELAAEAVADEETDGQPLPTDPDAIEPGAIE